MATILQHRRGTAAAHTTFTGAIGEVTVDTTNNTAVVHDGVTAGGHKLTKASANLSDLANAGSARTNLGLGTAAVANITTSANDTSAGRVLKVGDFGIGPGSVAVADADALALTGFFRTSSSWVGSVYPGTDGSNQGCLVSQMWEAGVSTYRQQVFYSINGPRGTWTRRMDAGVWSSWAKGYDQVTILGSVSQSAGVPTGAVIERGSNANGEYVRFADGTQICTRTQIINQVVSAGTSIGATKILAAAFTEPPVVSVQATFATGADFSGDILYTLMVNDNSTGPSFIFNTGRRPTAEAFGYSIGPSSAASRKEEIVAIGRWF